MVMGATNLPDDLDDAVLRRFTKRVFVPLPDEPARDALLRKMLPDHGSVRIRLSSSERRILLRLTEGYSCSDISSLAKEAAMGPVRDLDLRGGRNLTPFDVR